MNKEKRRTNHKQDVFKEEDAGLAKLTERQLEQGIYQGKDTRYHPWRVIVAMKQM